MEACYKSSYAEYVYAEFKQLSKSFIFVFLLQDFLTLEFSRVIQKVNRIILFEFCCNISIYIYWSGSIKIEI